MSSESSSAFSAPTGSLKINSGHNFFLLEMKAKEHFLIFRLSLQKKKLLFAFLTRICYDNCMSSHCHSSYLSTCNLCCLSPLLLVYLPVSSLLGGCTVITELSSDPSVRWSQGRFGYTHWKDLQLCRPFFKFCCDETWAKRLPESRTFWIFRMNVQTLEDSGERLEGNNNELPFSQWLGWN